MPDNGLSLTVESIRRSTTLRFWVPAASFAIIVVVMRLAAPVIVLILLSLLFSSLLAPILFWLERKGFGVAAADCCAFRGAG